MKRTVRWSFRKYLLYYSGIFIFASLGVFATFFYTRRSFVWKPDGSSQYFIHLTYAGRYLRDLASRVMHGDFRLRMFDFTIGSGSDVGTIVRTHPLDFLSVFVPEQYTELLYILLDYLRTYLSGVSFSIFALHFGKSQKGVIAGSLLYAFCGFILRDCLKHPQYFIPLILLPILLLAGEYLLEGRHLLFFSFMVFLGFVSNYYMMYMMAIALGVYLLIRFPAIFPKRRAASFIKVFLRLVFFFLLGTIMACVTLLPTVHMLQSSFRLNMGKEHPSMFSYGQRIRYIKWFINLIEPGQTLGHDTQLNHMVLALPALGLVVFGKKRNKPLIFSALLCIVMLLLPAGSYVMTGFSSTNGRWIYIFSFVLALCVADVWEELICPSRRDRVLLCFFLAVYLAAVCVYWARGYGNVYTIAGLLELTVVTAFIIRMPASGKKSREKFSKEWALVGLSCISVWISGYMLYSADFKGFASEFLHVGESRQQILSSIYTKPQEIKDLSFSRVDFDGSGIDQENYAVYLSYNGTSVFNSLPSASYMNYLLDQENAGLDAITQIRGLDGRSGQEALMDSGWYITQNQDPHMIPYGFVKDDELSDENLFVYRNQYLLPFGIGYTAAIPAEEYRQLNPVQKQQALLQAVRLDTIPDDIELADGSSYTVETVPVPIPGEAEGMQVCENGLQTDRENAVITVPFQRRAGYECYLRLRGLTHSADRSTVIVTSGGLRKLIVSRNIRATYSLGREDYTVCLGYDDADSEDQAQITFVKSGNYTLSGIELIYAPMDSYIGNIEKLTEGGLKDVVFDINTVTGNVSSQSKEVMVFSVPYSDGWEVSIDGSNTETFPANTGFLGTVVPAGDHTVKLTYTTPWAEAGRLASAAGWSVFLIIFFWTYKRKRAETAEKMETVQT